MSPADRLNVDLLADRIVVTVHPSLIREVTQSLEQLDPTLQLVEAALDAQNLVMGLRDRSVERVRHGQQRRARRVFGASQFD